MIDGRAVRRPGTRAARRRSPPCRGRRSRARSSGRRATCRPAARAAGRRRRRRPTGTCCSRRWRAGCSSPKRGAHSAASQTVPSCSSPSPSITTVRDGEPSSCSAMAMPTADRQRVAERAGGELHPRRPARRMAAEAAADAAPTAGSSAASILPSSARQAWNDVHRVALAEQEAIAPALRRVLELRGSRRTAPPSDRRTTASRRGGRTAPRRSRRRGGAARWRGAQRHCRVSESAAIVASGSVCHGVRDSTNSTATIRRHVDSPSTSERTSPARGCRP